MRHSARNHLIEVLILVLVVCFLFGCATKKETTQSDTKPAPGEVKTEDQTKSAPPEPPKVQQTTTPASSSSPPKTPAVSQSPDQRRTEIVLASVNLREGPSMDSRIISVLKKEVNDYRLEGGSFLSSSITN